MVIMKRLLIKDRVGDFFRRAIWELEDRQFGAPRRLALRLMQLATVVVREFVNDQCLLRASALTFATVLSIVPLLAIVFALLKGFGAEIDLEVLILDHVGAGSQEAVDAIFTYVSNSNMTRLGSLGLILLVFSVLTLLTNIEKSFNHIWGVRETRTLIRRFADYFSIAVIGPVLILVAVSMTTTVESQLLSEQLIKQSVIGDLLFFVFKLAPFFAMWAVFAGLYLFMPNTRISVRAALIGGAFGGILWQLVQWGYVNFQFGVSRYNAIYGTMAALPIFMMWIYVSWMIVLLGLEVTFAVQNIRTILRDFGSDRVSVAGRELATVELLTAVGRGFVAGEAAASAEELSARLGLSPRLVRQLLGQLVHLGYLAEVMMESDRSTAYQPARALETMSVAEVVAALRHEGGAPLRHRPVAEYQLASRLLQRVDEAAQQAYDGVSVADLVRRLPGEGNGRVSGP